MQVIPYVGADVAPRPGRLGGSSTLIEPETNIKVGTRFLFEQILKFGDVKKALVSYNMGETALRDLMRQNKPCPNDISNGRRKLPSTQGDYKV